NIDTARSEYRPDHLKLAVSACNIGQHFAASSGNASVGSDAPAGSARLKLNFGSTTACAITVFNTAATARESALQPVRLIADHASTTLTVRKGIVGVATDAPAQTATLGQVNVAHTGNVNRD